MSIGSWPACTRLGALSPAVVALAIEDGAPLEASKLMRVFDIRAPIRRSELISQEARPTSCHPSDYSGPGQSRRQRTHSTRAGRPGLAGR
jgi:hypothetical protein